MRLHQCRQPAALRFPAHAFHNHQGHRAGAGHFHLQPHQPRHHPYQRGHGVHRLRAPDPAAVRPVRGALLQRRQHGGGQAVRFLAALRLLRACLRGLGGRVRRGRVQLLAARNAHGRGYRGREGVPQRNRRAVPFRVQPQGAYQGLHRCGPYLHPAVRGAPARVRGVEPPACRAHQPEAGRFGRLPALLVRAGQQQLVLLLGRAAFALAAQAEHHVLRPRHAHHPAESPQRLHRFNRCAFR